MAIDALHSQWFVFRYATIVHDDCNVTFVARDFFVRTRQRKMRLRVVVEPEIRPAYCGMTPIAVRYSVFRELPLVFILVTVRTDHRQAGVLDGFCRIPCCHVTFAARNLCVFSA